MLTMERLYNLTQIMSIPFSNLFILLQTLRSRKIISKITDEINKIQAIYNKSAKLFHRGFSTLLFQKRIIPTT